MSDTDIYKKREAMPIGARKKPDKKRRRRSTHRAFDEESTRKRRSKNSGIRRLLHLSRKSDNEKYIWSSLGIIIVVSLILAAIWQFAVVEYLVRSEEKQDEYIQYQPSIPESSGSAAE